MKMTILCPLVFVVGCGGEVIFTETTGAGGHGNGDATDTDPNGDEDCIPCRGTDTSGDHRGRVCPDERAVHAALKDCSCSGQCAEVCGEIFCADFGKGGLCSYCQEEVCADELAECLCPEGNCVDPY